MASDAWTTIESDPGVFTELISSIGVQGVQVEELWGLDKESLEALKPVHGLVFLFKWTGEKEERQIAEDAHGQVFFASQVITNACATQAILSILLNTEGLELGPQLSSFKEFTSDFPPEMKGLAIGNSDAIRTAHNSFARPEPIVPDEKGPSGKDDDAFHFISYLPIGGTLYELDGLKPGPIALCECNNENWLELVGPHIQARIERYAASEIRFNLMAVVRDRLDIFKEKVSHISALLERVRSMLPTSEEQAGAGEGKPENLCDLTVETLPSSRGALSSLEAHLSGELLLCKESLQSEQEKRRRWHDENVRRRHNFLPLLFEVLRAAAEEGRMDGLIGRARNELKADK